MQAGSALTDAAPIIHHLWEPKFESHDNLYRLRIWVTHDGEEHGDCPCQTFVSYSRLKLSDGRIGYTFTHSLSNQTFESFDLLCEGTGALREAFEAPAALYKLSKCGVGHMDEEGRIDKGKMEAVVIDYETTNATESWRDFLARLNNVKENWLLDV